MKIKMLNNETINKIAAGEVIIRPVSVIKELVENAIDAKASRIAVAVEKGGKALIKVIDDGLGIAYNEVPLAFKRHATSKISTIEDLENVDTLGFRGEALSSIAAVARVRITTRARDEEIGSQSFFEGSALMNQRVCTYDKGTEICVTDLFYNTPARKKHLQKDKNEEKLIRDVLEKLALSHPEISFTYISDGREVFKTLGTGALKDIVESLYGRDFFKGLRPLNAENAPMRLRGYISDLTLTRSTREEQIFFINNRYVRNRGLSKAFEEAYAGYMMQHRHPVGIVFMELPGRMLDINIHPAKTEIQILNKSLVNILFRQGIRETLKAESLVVDMAQLGKASEGDAGAEAPQITETPVSFIDEDGFFNDAPAQTVQDKEEAFVSEKHTLCETEVKKRETDKAFSESAGVVKGQEIAVQSKTAVKADCAGQNEGIVRDLKGITDSKIPEEASVSAECSQIPRKSEVVREAQAPYRPPKKPDFDHVKIIGQLFSTYILLERGDEALLLDQHAAHEAFLYEELRQRFERKIDFPAQNLLVPQTVEISIKEAQDFDHLQEALLHYGFECDLFGETTLMVRSVPVMLGEPQDVELLRAFIESRVYDDAADPRDQIERIITMSCKKAVKGHQNLSHEEIRALLDGLSRLDNPYTCPHGRPIILKLREYELKKLFKRVV